VVGGYIKDVKPLNAGGELKQFTARFGANASITWEEGRENQDGRVAYLTVLSMGQLSGDRAKSESKGEGTKAIYNLFNKYPDVNELIYDDESKGFWKAIGGKTDTLARVDFLKYYSKKFA
jgi:hypothetical protein